MIGQIRGRLAFKHPPRLLVDVGGLGYEIEAPMTTFYALPEAGVEITLFTHLTIRDDAHLLFGFATENERSLFRALIKVNGVGAKLALTILSGIDADQFVKCIHDNDASSLVRLPGIGKKTAERLIVEMRDSLSDWRIVAPADRKKSGRASSSEQSDEATSALITLGYKPQEASRLVNVVRREKMTSETIIREALKIAIRR